MNFLRRLSANAGVPGWFYEARREGIADQPIIQKIRNEISRHVRENNYDSGKWDERFINDLSHIIFAMWSVQDDKLPTA